MDFTPTAKAGRTTKLSRERSCNARADAASHVTLPRTEQRVHAENAHFTRQTRFIFRHSFWDKWGCRPLSHQLNMRNMRVRNDLYLSWLYVIFNCILNYDIKQNKITIGVRGNPTEFQFQSQRCYTIAFRVAMPHFTQRYDKSNWNRPSLKRNKLPPNVSLRCSVL